jgi:WD40 repeat protein
MSTTVFRLDAVTNQGNAEAQARKAAARSLVQQARRQFDADPVTALRLGVAADSLDHSPDTHALLVDQLARDRLLATMSGGSRTGGVAVNPRNHVAIIGGSRGDAALWDLANPQKPVRLATLGSGGSGYTLAAVSADGTTAAASAGTAITVWDITQPAQPRRLATLDGRGSGVLSGGLDAIALSPDGRALVSGGGFTASYLWDLTDPTAPRRLSGPGDELIAAAFASTGHTIVTSRVLGNVVEVWDTTEPDHLQRVAQLPGLFEVLAVAISDDGHRVLTGSKDTTAVVWDVTDPQRVRQLGTLRGATGPVDAVALGQDGTTAATGSTDGTTTLWELRQPLSPLAISTLHHSSPVQAAALTADGSILITASNLATQVWSVRGPLAPHVGGVLPTTHGGDVAIGPDHHVLVAGEPATLWDTSNVDTPASGPAFDAAATVAIGPDGKTAVIGDTIQDLARRVALIHLPADAATKSAVYIGPSTVVTAGNGPALVWSLDRASPIGRIDPGSAVRRVAANPARHLVLADADQSLTLWDASEPTNPRRLAALTGSNGIVGGIAINPAGTLALVGDNAGFLGVWDLGDPAHPRRVAQTKAASDFLASVAFTADGRMALTATPPGPPVVWDLTNPAEPLTLLTLDRAPTIVQSLAVGPEATVVGGADKGAQLWNISVLAAAVTDPLTSTCALIGRGLDPDQWRQFAPAVPYTPTCP